MAKKESKQPSKSRGLGDTLKAFFDKTGVSKLAEMWEEATGKDCGCDARQEKLNQIFPYKKVECLTQDEYEFIESIKDKNTIRGHEKNRIDTIYNRVFKENVEATSCTPCVRDRINRLTAVASTYEP